MRNWKEWTKAALVRAVRTFAQTALSLVTVGQAFNEVDWLSVASISGVAAAISILMSLAGLPETENAPAEVWLEKNDEEE